MKSNKGVLIDNHNLIWTYLKSILVAYMFALFIFLIMALLITYTNISEAIVPMIASITMVISGAISGIYAGAKLKRRGWLNGALVGLIYILLLIIMSWIFMESFSLDRFVFYKSLAGIIAGGVGGMIGVNLK